MSASVAGRTAVITGASRGLGAGMAKAMHQRGVKLALCARAEPVLSGEEHVFTQQLDVSDERAVMQFAERAADALGHIDLWINNAGVLEPMSFIEQLDSGELMRHLAVNVGGVVHGCRAFATHLRQTSHHGVLINISSGAALKGYAGWGAYCASKAAVDRITECLQLEQGDRMRAYAVAPGVIDTAMQEMIRSMTAEQFPMVDKFIQLKADNAFNTPGFVADRILDIAFDDNARPNEVVLRLPADR
jgi:benzil reductase ((S)-benzoin forming)